MSHPRPLFPGARPVLPAPSPVLSGLAFWHGTPHRNIASILEEGLDPARTMGGYNTCLTTRPEAALFFARLHAGVQGSDTPDDRPVLIRIEGSMLDPRLLDVERGSYRIFPYGRNLKWRRHAMRLSSAKTWQDSLSQVDAVSYRGMIPVRKTMLVCDFENLSVPEFDALLEEADSGYPQDPATIQALEAFREIHNLPRMHDGPFIATGIPEDLPLAA